MIFFKTLGFLDLLTVIVLAGAAMFSTKFLIYAAIYLILKALFFISISNDFASYGDAAAGFYMLALAAGISFSALTTLFLMYLGQKTLFTFVKISIEAYWLYKFLKNTKGRSYESAYFYMR